MAQIDREDVTQDEREASDRAYLRKMLNQARRKLAVAPEVNPDIGTTPLLDKFGKAGMYDPISDKIRINPKLTRDESLIHHELQHAMQVNQWKNAQKLKMQGKYPILPSEDVANEMTGMYYKKGSSDPLHEQDNPFSYMSPGKSSNAEFLKDYQLKRLRERNLEAQKAQMRYEGADPGIDTKRLDDKHFFESRGINKSKVKPLD